MPSAPRRFAAARCCQAPTASIPPGEVGSSGVSAPSQGRKFHCRPTQPPGTPGGPSTGPGSLGTSGSAASEALELGEGGVGVGGGGEGGGGGGGAPGAAPQGGHRAPHADSRRQADRPAAALP